MFDAVLRSAGSWWLRRSRLAVVGLIVFHGAGVEAQRPAHDVLLFTSARHWQHRELNTPILDEDDFSPAVDVFYTRTADRFRILGEYLVTDEENELERLQFGWQLTDSTRFWLGRFHQPSSYWNTEHHHGQFLQTSLTRPASEEFEDLGGLLPSHTTGAMLEHHREIGETAGLQLSFSTGLTSVLAPDGLEPFDLLDPESAHGRSASLRAGFLPDALGDDEIGFTYSTHEVNVKSGVSLPTSWSPLVDEVEVVTYGLYAVWIWDKWRLTASGTTVETTPSGRGGGPNGEAVFSYAQIERQIKGHFTAYTRVEHASGDTDYLELFPKFQHDQSVLGARWLFRSKHALTFEVANAVLLRDHYHRVGLQWSAVLP